MSRIFWTKAKLLGALVGLVAFVLGCAAGAPATAGKYKDGIYEGTSTQGMEGPIGVKVTVEKGKITDVTVTESHETQGVGSVSLDQLPAEVIANQGTQGVDTVSGASTSSKAFLEAVDTALASAL